MDALDAAVRTFAPAELKKVCVLATAAAFRGPRDAIDELSSRGVWGDLRPVGVEALDRASASDHAVLSAVDAADLVVLVDGAVLHARSVWRATPLGESLRSHSLLAVGSVGSVLGDTMIDPRGGAPTTGLGFFDDVVVTVTAGEEQTLRTRSLLGQRATLLELGRHSVVTFDGQWRVVVDDDLLVTRDGVVSVL
jgi:hypothetical protein